MKRKLGFIALIAIIGFLSACGGDDGGTTTVSVTGITLNKSNINLNVDDTETLTATVTPSNATNKAVTWSTSNAAVATVSNGVVTAVATGSTTIIVTTVDKGIKAECSVDVNDPSLSTLSGTIAISQSGTVTVNTELTATYDGTETVSFQWKKDGNNIGTATTTNPNKYTPTTEGNYSVTVSMTGFNSKTSAPVTVKNADETGGNEPSKWITVTTDAFDYKNNGNTFKAAITSIAYGNGIFVAACTRGIIAYSSDGITWTAADTGTAFVHEDVYTYIADVNTIAFGNGTFVAGGGARSNGSSAITNPKMATSPDGITWTEAPSRSTLTSGLRVFEARDISKIVFGNGIFVAINLDSDYTRRAISTDGIIWEYSNIGSNETALSFCNDMFLQGDKQGHIYYSSNGKNWQTVEYTDFRDTEPIYSFAYGNGAWVAIGYNSSMAEGRIRRGYTKDITKWISYEFIEAFTYYKPIIFYNGKFIAIGKGQKIITSTDGLKWTFGEEIPFIFNAIVGTEGMLLIGGANGQIAYSTSY
jgi:hypothetical protein